MQADVSNAKATVLVVDDVPDNVYLLKEALEQDYKVKAALNGLQALKVARSDNKPDIILLDVMMPEMDGYEVCKQLKADPTTSKIPVIFVTAKDLESDEKRGLQLGAVDYINKPIRPAIVQARVKTHLALYDQNRALSEEVEIRTREVEDTRLEIIHRLGRAAEYKDNETGLHVIRMGWYSRLIAEKMGANEDYVDLIFKAAPMHDIGKIGIPDRVLQKPGKLDAEEWEIMKRHSQYGAKILGEHNHALLQMAKEIALYHHEKWNGTGYPRGLCGDAIPVSARIVAIADVFDALTSERPYKKAWPAEKAFQLIADEAGEHFDPALASVFLAHKQEAINIMTRFKESADSSD